MREKLRDSSESPSAKYEQLLKDGVSLQKKYETLGKKVDYAEVIRAFNAGEMSVQQLKNVAPPNSSEELTDEEFDDFCKARVKLARKLGYEVDSDGHEGASNWFDVKKNGLKFSMKHYATRSDLGITGFSRVSKFGVSSIEGEKESYMWFDRGWDSACSDPKVQKEIDRVLAIFG